jgi:hypothetical protein
MLVFKLAWQDFQPAVQIEDLMKRNLERKQSRKDEQV